jgi:hypothetical protein
VKAKNEEMKRKREEREGEDEKKGKDRHGEMRGGRKRDIEKATERHRDADEEEMREERRK